MYTLSKSVASCFLFVATLAISVDVKAEDLSSIQECLTFEGFYWGLADGSPGPLTDSAIKAFQRSIGRPETETGLLTPYDAARLNEACEERKRKLGWAPYHLASSNITIELPLGILKRDQNVNNGQSLTGFGDAIRISLFDTLRASLDDQNTICAGMQSHSMTIDYKSIKKNWCVVAGPQGGWFYGYSRLDEGRLFYYTISWAESVDWLVHGVHIMILNSFKKHNFGEIATTSATYAPVQPALNIPRPVTGKLSPTEIFKRAKGAVWVLLSFDLKFGKPDLENSAQGSAIAVGPTALLTNCHTLKDHSVHFIARQDIDAPIRVWIKAADYSGDRCVLQTRNRLPSYVEIKPYDTIDIGEDAYSIGTPQGFDLTIANGIVSGKRDMKGIRYLQTTAPISGSSSGGGLFDCSGRLMGITTFYIDGQNLNFAIAAHEFR
jgi:peptidoglycan hydrolase-like protein with peptidoglycan-binding domain